MRLELKLLADVGLVGLPNAGKSTLLARVSAARPKIADYPFTTLTPNLGIVSVSEGQNFVMADIPGIISGAGRGRGLGDKFLRHIERTNILVFVIEASSESVAETYAILAKEVEHFNPALSEKKRIVGISKIDLLSGDKRQEIVKHLPDKELIFFSSVTGAGIDKLTGRLYRIKEEQDNE